MPGMPGEYEVFSTGDIAFLIAERYGNGGYGPA
jgi:hypothetical protein